MSRKRRKNCIKGTTRRKRNADNILRIVYQLTLIANQFFTECLDKGIQELDNERLDELSIRLNRYKERLWKKYPAKNAIIWQGLFDFKRRVDEKRGDIYCRIEKDAQ